LRAKINPRHSQTGFLNTGIGRSMMGNVYPSDYREVSLFRSRIKNMDGIQKILKWYSRNWQSRTGADMSDLSEGLVVEDIFSFCMAISGI
jgi:hypothetical protein